MSLNATKPSSKVGLVTCVALVMANMIGTGVFTSLGYQLADLQSPLLALLIWGLGGLFAFCGSMCYAELASIMPRSGGEYNYLSRIYHPSIGFMAGIVSIVAGFSAPVALGAMAFGKYFHAAFPSVSPLMASLFVVALTTTVHMVNLKTSRSFQIGATVLKLVLIGGFLSIGFVNPSVEWSRISMPAPDWSLLVSPAFAIALMFALYSYSGWNAATYIAGEVKNSSKVVGLSLLIGTTAVTVIYLLLNLVFILNAPSKEMAGQLDVGRVVAEHIFGSAGGKLIAGLISLGLISAISSMMWAGPRVAQRIGQDFPQMRFLARTNAAGIPVLAVALQGTLVGGLILTSSFESVVVYTQFALVSCLFLTTLGVFVLRWREPWVERPFKCWFYPFTPALFLVIATFTLLYSMIRQPGESLAGLATLVVGVGLYFVCKKTSQTHD